MTEVKCPVCKGTGKQPGYGGRMSCQCCLGSGKIKKGSKCPHCPHPKKMHSKLEHMGVQFCNGESSGGGFTCGCAGTEKYPQSLCNVCGKDFGNIYCLNDHLGKSPECKKDFKITWY